MGRNIDYLMDRLAAKATNTALDSDMRCLLAEARAAIETFDYALRRTLDAIGKQKGQP